MTVQFPQALDFLFHPARYKVAYGGRGGAKSWGFARALLLLGMQRNLRILCTRDIQKSITESVHQLLSDQIRKPMPDGLGIGGFYEVLDHTIRGSNGTEFLFAGLRTNIDSVKSLEACDIVWVEEARSVRKESWEILIPTIRKENSEIWISFNPIDDADYTYQRFVVQPPRSAVVRKMIYSDNPWFPEVLRKEMEDLKSRDLNAYRTVWLGECFTSPIGALWTQKSIDDNRRHMIPTDDIIRIVVAVDPAVSTAETSADTGIVVAALMQGGEVYVLDDRTVHASPIVWGREAIAAYYKWRADRIVAEINNGGDLVEANIMAIDDRVSFRQVRASRSKAIRAEPVASLYEKGRVHHVGYFAELEHQMIRFVPGLPADERVRLDRMDALVWAVTELVIDQEQVTATRSLARIVRISRY